MTIEWLMERLPLLLFISELLLIPAALFFFVTKKRVIGLIPVVVLLVLLGLAFFQLTERGTITDVRGWVGAPGLSGSIAIGFVISGVTLPLVALITLCSVAVMGGMVNSVYQFRIIAAAMLGTSGAAISWFSATPWFGFFGLILCLVAALMGHSLNESAEHDAGLIARFGSRTLLSLFLGVFAMASLLLGHFPQLGAVLLALSVFLIFGGVRTHFSEKDTAGNVPHARLPAERWVQEVLPTLSGMAILFKMNSALKAAEVLPTLSAVASMWSVLVILRGLHAKSLEDATSAWICSSALLVCSVFFLQGDAAIVPLLVGFIISSSVIGILGVKECPTVLIFSWAAFASGFLFSINSINLSLGLAQLIHGEQYFVLTTYLVGLTFYIAYTWEIAWRRTKRLETNSLLKLAAEVPSPFSRVEIILCSALVFLMAGFIWNGHLFGGVLSGILNQGDAFLPSFLKVLKLEDISAENTTTPFSEQNLIIAAATYWLVQVFALFFIYWYHRVRASGPSLFERSRKMRALATLSNSSDEFLTSLNQRAPKILRALQARIEEVPWSVWLPKGLYRPIQWSAKRATKIEGDIWTNAASTVTRMIATHGRLTQMVQSGNGQWYVFFGLLIAVVMVFFNLKR